MYIILRYLYLQRETADYMGKLVPNSFKNDSYKLSRLEIEIPNTLDHVWKLDIKKSYIELPHEIKFKLKEQIKNLVNRSKDTFKKRVTIEPPNHSPLWKKKLNHNKVQSLTVLTRKIA